MTTTGSGVSGVRTAQKTLIIDADAHVTETERSWAFMDPGEEKYRPILDAPPDAPKEMFWNIGGRQRGFRFNQIHAEAARLMQGKTGRRTDVPVSASEVDDIAARLRVMDQTGIDIQICHNTLWIETVADDAAQESALCRSWNRWVAEAWQQAPERIRWSCVVPTLDLGEAVRQARFAKENGAVAVCMRPVEGRRIVTDSYFFPIFEAAQELDMAMAIHIANGNPENVALWRGALGNLATFRAPTVLACAAVINSTIIEKFPRLRWGFIEASASWMSWLDAEMKQRTGSRGAGGNIFADHNIYVSCQNGDDIPYLIKQGFLDSLVIGTDFGHFDAASDVDAITKFQANALISGEEKRKILFTNPKKLYAL